MITGFKIKMPSEKFFSERIKKAQKFVDSEVLRKSDPYILKQVCLETLGFWEQKSEVVGFGILHHMQKSNITRDGLAVSVDVIG